jgi:hypothetical protein
VRSACARHPQAQGRRRQIDVTGDRADRLAVIQDHANGLAAKLLIELPAWAPTFPAFGHSGHRIHLSEDVHETGSSHYGEQCGM